VWRRANRAIVGTMVLVATVTLAMIVGDVNDPFSRIVVPLPGETPPQVPTTMLVEVVATQPVGSANMPSTSGSPQIDQPPLAATVQPPLRQTAQGTAPAAKAPTETTTRTTTPAPPAPPPPGGGSGPVIVCPNVAGALPPVPAGAQSEVARELRYLEAQLAEANSRLVASQGTSDPSFVRNAILGPLTSRRIASLDRIAIAIGRFGPRPAGLERLAPCDVR
jgi:hypothetical protein